jgi:hypothetical protein
LVRITPASVESWPGVWSLAVVSGSLNSLPEPVVVTPPPSGSGGVGFVPPRTSESGVEVAVGSSSSGVGEAVG